MSLLRFTFADLPQKNRYLFFMPHSNNLWTDALQRAHEGNKDHRAHRSGWLRAAVLGANDGLVSNSSLMVGVAAAGGSFASLITAGVAGIAAGAMSMAVGEYVSVSSQTDIENADMAVEKRQHAENPTGELEELAHLYVERGLPAELAMQVAQHMHQKDALEAHMRDELGQFEHTKANPLQAAVASGISFTAGGVVPLVTALVAGSSIRTMAIVLVTIIGLAVSGAVGGKVAGTRFMRPAIRVMIGGTAGMLVTAVITRIAHVSGI